VSSAATQCADVVKSVTVDLSSSDIKQADADDRLDLSACSDHLYCRTETADECTTLLEPTVEQTLKVGHIDAELTQCQSSASCIGTRSESLESGPSQMLCLGSVCSSSDESWQSKPNSSQSLLGVVAMQAVDATPSTFYESSDVLSELDVAHTEDVSLGSATTSGISDDSMLMLDTDRQLADGAIDAADNSEVVDLTDGRTVELECQCGVHYSNTNDKLHVVECQRCHSHQHATCVNYDLTNPLRGNYLCPHCHVVEVSV